MIGVDTSVTPQDTFATATIGAKQALVVDDSAAQRLVLAKNLERWGYQVTQAASGDTALQLCQTNRFDLILSDWMMPGMNGLDFLPRLSCARSRKLFLFHSADLQ